MPNFKDRIYNAYGETTSRNIYRVGAYKGDTEAVFEHRWGRFLPKDKQSPILDIGCGSGQFLQCLQKKGYTDLTGVDVSPDQVGFARESGLENIVLADAYDFLSNSSEQYAVISAFSLFEHLTREDLFDYLDAIVTSLVPGGLLLGLTPNAKGPFGSHIRYADITHELSFTPETILQISRTIGLKPIFIGECGPVPHGLISVVRWGIWQVYRAIYHLARVAQAADYRYPIYTQDLRFVLEKPFK